MKKCINIPNRILKVKVDKEMNCFDELDNYIGKGEIINNKLIVTYER